MVDEEDRWKLLTVRNWGESLAGDWTLSITDLKEGHKEDCVDAPSFQIFYTNVWVTCDYLVSNEMCMNGDISDEFFFGTGFEPLLKVKDDKNDRTLQEACCDCGGGIRRTDFVDTLRQWRLVLYGRTVTTDVPTTESPSSPPTTRAPTALPSLSASKSPTQSPSDYPSSVPTTSRPSGRPSHVSSSQPSTVPSPHPVTLVPTTVTSGDPSRVPSDFPTTSPSRQQSYVPTIDRSLPSSQEPSGNPTKELSEEPSSVPFANPSSANNTGEPSNSAEPSQVSPTHSAMPSSERRKEEPSSSPSRTPTSRHAPSFGSSQDPVQQQQTTTNSTTANSGPRFPSSSVM
jgi:hypothetical protein